MKYKHILSAIHNFGDSFLSLMNYVDDDYVIDDLNRLHAEGYDIEIDWIQRSFKPRAQGTKRILKSVAMYGDNLARHLASQDVDLNCIKELRLVWPAKGRKLISALDDRGFEHKTFVRECK